MGLLAPLYFAGLLAIGLPILFHLIRRTPHGRQEFSSLMFLSPSPPRLTRRSRLTNILLLILRALALALLAIAFARPFFHWGDDLGNFNAAGRRIALLVDTSASMRRGDLWQQATRQVEEALKDTTPADQVGLFLFDEKVHPALTFAEWTETDPSRREAVLRARLADAKPSWRSTKLGDALATGADLLAETEGSRSASRIERQIILISDMQQGGHVDTLQGHQWPTGVLLQVRPVTPKLASNADVQWVKQAGDETDSPSQGRLRLRVSNQPGSSQEQLSLVWANGPVPLLGIPPVKVYVAPGRSQIVRVAWPKDGRAVDRLVLSGDDSDFDNTLYVVPPRVESVRVLYVGTDAPDDVKGLRYYFQNAAEGSPTRKLQLIARRPDEPISPGDLPGTRLAIVTSALPEAQWAKLRAFAESGGEVLWVLRDAASAQGLGSLLGTGPLEISEATGDFALITRVDFDHPLFAPFADARFSDFTMIHFWKHRRIKLPPEADVRVLAWFEGSEPFLIQRTLGQGRLLVATSGWDPGDSQLALSTKFVPLIDGLLRRPDAARIAAQYSVDEPIALQRLASAQSTRSILRPDGRRVELAGTATVFDGADQPGIYRISAAGEQTDLAVNLAPDESRTAPVPVEELERWGAKLGNGSPRPDQLEQERRLRRTELENRQKVWRWLILGVLALLAMETALAGRLARRNLREQVAS